MARPHALAALVLLGACAPIVTIGARGKPVGGLELDEARVRCESKEACACASLGRFAAADNDAAGAESAFKKGCELGCADACSDWSELLLEAGRDTDKATKLALRSCEANGALCEKLAKRFEEGRGVPKDAEKARLVRVVACQQGVASSCAR